MKRETTFLQSLSPEKKAELLRGSDQSNQFKLVPEYPAVVPANIPAIMVISPTVLPGSKGLSRTYQNLQHSAQQQDLLERVHFLEGLLYSSQNYNCESENGSKISHRNKLLSKIAESDDLIIKSKYNALLTENQELRIAVENLKEERRQDAESGLRTQQEMKNKIQMQQQRIRELEAGNLVEMQASLELFRPALHHTFKEDYTQAPSASHSSSTHLRQQLHTARELVMSLTRQRDALDAKVCDLSSKLGSKLAASQAAAGGAAGRAANLERACATLQRKLEVASKRVRELEASNKELSEGSKQQQRYVTKLELLVRTQRQALAAARAGGGSTLKHLRQIGIKDSFERRFQSSQDLMPSAALKESLSGSETTLAAYDGAAVRSGTEDEERSRSWKEAHVADGNMGGKPRGNWHQKQNAAAPGVGSGRSALEDSILWGEPSFGVPLQGAAAGKGGMYPMGQYSTAGHQSEGGLRRQQGYLYNTMNTGHPDALKAQQGQDSRRMVMMKAPALTSRPPVGSSSSSRAVDRHTVIPSVADVHGDLEHEISLMECEILNLSSELQGLSKWAQKPSPSYPAGSLRDPRSHGESTSHCHEDLISAESTEPMDKVYNLSGSVTTNHYDQPCFDIVSRGSMFLGSSRETLPPSHNPGNGYGYGSGNPSASGAPVAISSCSTLLQGLPDSHTTSVGYSEPPTATDVNSSTLSDGLPGSNLSDIRLPQTVPPAIVSSSTLSDGLAGGQATDCRLPRTTPAVGGALSSKELLADKGFAAGPSETLVRSDKSDVRFGSETGMEPGTDLRVEVRGNEAGAQEEFSQTLLLGHVVHPDHYSDAPPHHPRQRPSSDASQQGSEEGFHQRAARIDFEFVPAFQTLPISGSTGRSDADMEGRTKMFSHSSLGSSNPTNPGLTSSWHHLQDHWNAVNSHSSRQMDHTKSSTRSVSPSHLLPVPIAPKPWRGPGSNNASTIKAPTAAVTPSIRNGGQQSMKQSEHLLDNLNAFQIPHPLFGECLGSSSGQAERPLSMNVGKAAEIKASHNPPDTSQGLLYSNSAHYAWGPGSGGVSGMQISDQDDGAVEFKFQAGGAMEKAMTALRQLQMRHGKKV
ncbi:hypothetical protein CEUSTIGMA_g1145.t1 [Chlamydomonas eustigma]|uniref:Uncharacterized protein n=1 Tax=Chlamydomonas eustigma TaxID=1157962 RepID=A0A250WS81_9CHLO|nr:hypothetical protein CEUSTIGMA_g1145.t1 [Chlamydomonas eustigma]|eukprot:GAX73693.1 hypothetical protein CEUSTIGMA_g1145.t1 [Chlamydomonas eustigma]